MQPGLLLGHVQQRPLWLPEAALASSRQHAIALGRELGSRDSTTSLAAYWSLASRSQQWQHIIDRLGWARARAATVVEVGSGMGLFVLTGQALGLNVLGVEFSADRYGRSLRIAQELLLANTGSAPLINAPAEALPLASASVDLVASFQTLEHVRDLRQTLREMHRILKPGGMLFAQAPNYRSFYEAHYGIVAPLGLGKTALRQYLQLRRRPTSFLAHLQWLSPAALRSALREVGFSAITVTRITPPHHSAGPLPIMPAALPFRFRRGRFGYRAAFALALISAKLGEPDTYPQLQIWASRE